MEMELSFRAHWVRDGKGAVEEGCLLDEPNGGIVVNLLSVVVEGLHLVCREFMYWTKTNSS